MAHNINYNEQTGKHSFFSVKEKAWHGLGQIVSEYPTSAEAIRFAGLDYEVAKLPNVHRMPDGKEVISGNSFFTYRSDTGAILGDKLGTDYHVVQNRDAFTFFDVIVQEDSIRYETAGALGKGERIFITAKLPGYIRVGSDDLVEKYLFLTTSHDGFGSITAAFTPVRIVCANTLNAAMRNHSNAIKVRHTANAKERLEEAHKLMGISNSLSSELERIFNQWTKVRISDPDVKRLIQMAMAPNKEVLQNIQAGKDDEGSTYYRNECNAAYAYALSNPTQQQKTASGTLFGAYNSVTGYFQNVRTYKDSEAKLKFLLFNGAGQTKVQKAFELCEAFALKGRSALFLN